LNLKAGAVIAFVNGDKRFRWFSAAVKEPYRIFFPLGIFWGAVGISQWLFYALKWIPAYSMQLHSAIQTEAYMGCFIVGFLLTAMPRFASAKPASVKEFLVFLVLLNAAPVFYLLHQWMNARLCFAAWLLMLAFFAARRFLNKKNSGIQPPVEFVWIPAALLNGLSGVLMMTGADLHLFPSAANKTGKLLAEQGFLLSLVLGVGSFLGPRLMGTFRPSFQISKDVKILRRERAKALYLNAASAVCLLLTFCLEGLGMTLPAFLARAFIIGLIYFRSRTLVLKPLVKDEFALLLWASFWMVFLGQAGVVFFPVYRPAFLHITFLGGYAVMTFAVATMVIFSHGGQPKRLEKRTWQLPAVSAFLAFALVLRIAAVFFPEFFFILLASASVGWLLAAGLWLILISKPLFTSLTKEEFERCHDETRERVAALKTGRLLKPEKPQED